MSSPFQPRSHSILDPHPVAPDLERVVCDVCGQANARRVGTLPPPERLPWPMHRLGASVLALDGHAIHLVECQGCGLVYMNPRLTERAVERFYDAVYAASAAEMFESDQAGQVRYYLDALSRFVRAPQPHLLDIGCGAGQLLIQAQARGWRIDGAELSAYAAQHASRALGAPIHHGDFRTMGLPPGSLDAVTLIHVIEHVRAPVDFLRDAAALLKPGGVLMFDAPNVDSAEARLARWLGQPWRGFIIEHLTYFRPALLRRLVRDLGLELLAIDGYLPDVPPPNPLRDLRAMRGGAGPARFGAAPGPGVPPLPPVSLPRRVLRQAANYLFDAVAALTARRHDTSANAVFVWARRPEQA
ncbi:MAG TPA: class I SAM-dependent methyltransferase [Aggregatilineaceae bacterium]|mgnify:CR=1 FL=1|nr:class I SAM-dependent methyltransferase [Aggregatilineaceae bacterium]